MIDTSIRFMQGNEAVAEGCLAAGVSFYAGYPITPSTEIAEILSRRLPQFGGVFIQMEDEIASMAAIIGASLGGAKSTTATSGPGFSLMQENIGYAAAAEVPCVIINVQRAGPSTGQPTSPSQGDIMQARWGTHGDHPIIVLYPSGVREAFDLTVRAFNLAEQYRSPVILLLDEVIGHMREKVELPESVRVVDRQKPTVPPEWYFPYDDSVDVPPLASFGEGYRYHVTGLYHDRAGFPTLRPDEINPWMDRLHGKIERNLDDIILVGEEQLEDADRLVVACGACARSARAAVKTARQEGIKAGLLNLLTVWPFAEKLLDRLCDRAEVIVCPELNRGQIRLEVERVVRGRARVVGVNRSDGELIPPGDILRAISEG